MLKDISFSYTGWDNLSCCFYFFPQLRELEIYLIHICGFLLYIADTFGLSLWLGW